LKLLRLQIGIIIEIAEKLATDFLFYVQIFSLKCKIDKIMIEMLGRFVYNVPNTVSWAP